LYEAGLDRQQILELYRLLDWLMRLPEGLEREYKEQLTEFERSRSMPYITSIERMGRDEGRRAGRQEGREEGRQGQVDMALRLLRRRCGALSPAIESKVRVLSPQRLTDLAEALLDFSGLEDLERWLESR
jgi:predicted transposase YdaD